MIAAVLSGGLDSTCALAVVGGVELAVSFDYGQRHRRELHAAEAVAAHYGIEHEVVNLRGLLVGRSALLHHGEIPEGRYDDPSMSSTVVPGRNLLFAAATVPRLTAGDTLVVGVHAGDHPIYPDCRPEFWEPLAQAIDAAYGVTVRTPFLYRTKAELLQAGIAHHAPVWLTWSCYQGGAQHCGRCGTCVERAEAFALADIPDPTVYADPHFWRTAVNA